MGLRELKNKLSEYVREVRSGESVLVTDRGEVVAELSSPGQRSDESGLPQVLAALARQGALTPSLANDAAAYPRLPRILKGRGAAELLDAERGAK